jgi:hypothetical protein
MGQRHAAAFKFKMRWEQLENETTTRRQDFIARHHTHKHPAAIHL